MRWAAAIMFAVMGWGVGCAKHQGHLNAPDPAGWAESDPQITINIPTAEEVDEALSRAVSFLRRQRELHANAAPNLHEIAMSTWALMENGEHEENPWIKAQIELLSTLARTGREEAAFRLLALGYVSGPRHPDMKEALSKNGTALLGELFRKDGERVVLAAEGRHYSAYGAEALDRLQRHGYELPDWTWDALREGWLSIQLEDGSWSDRGNTDGSQILKLTCMGLRACHLARENKPVKAVDCTGSIRDIPLERATASLAARYSILYKSDRPYETMYWMAKAMGSVGRKRIGSHDWFREGLEFLLANQNEDGSWGKAEHTVEDTAFAILFLTHGRQPVFACKLDYSGAWNQRPCDVARLATYIGRWICRDFMSWQVVDFQHTEDWLDAPFLFISGSNALQFNQAQILALRTYVEDGGLIVGHADCNSTAFARSFEQLGNKLFPQYEFRELPEDHVLLNCAFRADHWKRLPRVLGVSNGARELMLLLPMEDIARIAQLNQLHNPQSREKAEIMVNLIMYASGKQFPYREQRYLMQWLDQPRR